MLLNKQKAIGLDDFSKSLISSYLKNRFQKTEVKSNFSDLILGPLLFLIYVNDMEAVVSSRVILYADDSALLVSGRSVSVIKETLRLDMNCLS